MAEDYSGRWLYKTYNPRNFERCDQHIEVKFIQIQYSRPMISSKKQATLSSQVAIRWMQKTRTCAHAPFYSLPAFDIVSVLNGDTLGHMIDLVDTNKSRGKFELQVDQLPVSGEGMSNGLTMLLRNEMTMNWAFFVRSLM